MMALIGTSIPQTPGFDDEFQTGGGSPIQEPTYTPFLLSEPTIDEITIKKIYDLFPRSLRVAQLTSNELLELLQSQIEDKDNEIQRLLEIIASFSNTTVDLSTLETLLGTLGQSTEGILDSIVGTQSDIGDLELSNKITTLEQSGFTRVGNTLLFFKVNNDPSNSFVFNINHTDENGKGIRASDLQTPNSVEFRNLSDTTLVFTKQEKWTSNDDNRGTPRNTNAFNFIDLPGIRTTGVTIGPDQTRTSRVTLGYTSKNAYDSVGLTRKGATNTWFGDMIIKTDNITANMGNMRLFRDRS